MSHTVDIPGRTLAIVCVQNDLDPMQSRSLYEIRPNDMFIEKYPNLCIIPMIHNMDVHRNEWLPLVVINFALDDVNLLKGESIGYMCLQPLEISEIVTETATKPSSLMCENDEKKVTDNQKEIDIEEKVEKKFITSPADIKYIGRLSYKMLMYPRNKNKHLKTYVQNLLTYFLLIQVILEKHHC